jgi:predicted dienelactone hydrolase
VLRLVILLFTACISIACPAAAAGIGFERATVAASSGEPIEVGIWSPEGDGTRRALVVISHGTGGDYRSHIDTAHALAAAGFIVAAITHPGDNWRDSSRSWAVWRRSHHLKLVVDHMLLAWGGRHSLDSRRIGAFGFSAGGFTVLVAAGGVPDLARMWEHCRANPRFFDCALAGRAPVQLAGAINWVHDPRLRAVAVAAPALGFTFGREGLRRVRVPVQLWRAERDEILPHPHYAEQVRRSLPRPPRYRIVPGAGHFDFLSPCSPDAAALRPQFCSSAPGFDRAAFHNRMNADLISFFRRHLTRARAPAARGAASRGGGRGASARS